MEGSTERVGVAINTMRARLTILGFNLAIVTFQISNTRVLSGGIHFEGLVEGIETTVHLSAATVLLTGVALSIASMVTFLVSSAHNRDATCDHWPLLAGDLLMYLALAQTVTGFFSPYEHALETVSMSTEVDQEALSVIRIGMAVAGSAAWLFAAYMGPIVSLLRSPYGRVYTLLHGAAYLGVLVCISHLWWAAQRIEGRSLAGDLSPSAWLNAFAAPLFW
jgi:hypothetical protein